MATNATITPSPWIALICGGIRKIADFAAILSYVLKLRDEGTIDEIVLSTWSEDINGTPGLESWLQRKHIHVAFQSNKKWSSTLSIKVEQSIVSALIQDAQLRAGIAKIEEITESSPGNNTILWKLRTDLMVSRLGMMGNSLRSMREKPWPEADYCYVHHISMLETFDIADISYVCTLQHAKRIGNITTSCIMRAQGKHIPTESIMFGSYYNDHYPSFARYSSLDYEKRRAFRLLVIDCIQQGKVVPSIAQQLALYLVLLSKQYRLLGNRSNDESIAIESFFSGDKRSLIYSYREANYFTGNTTTLELIVEGRVTACTLFGRHVVDNIREYSNLNLGMETQLLSSSIDSGLRAEVELFLDASPDSRSIIDRSCTSSKDYYSKDARYAALSDFLILVKTKEEYKITDHELQHITSCSSGSYTELASLTLTTLSRSMHQQNLKDTKAVAQERLHFWADLFASMDILDYILSEMANIDPTYVPSMDNSRQSQAQWLSCAEISLGFGN